MTKSFFGGLILILVGLLLPAANWTIAHRALFEISPPVLQCARPNVINAGHCRRLEKEILSTTVRFVIQTWTMADEEEGYVIDVAAGHGTVKDGQYLVTHNHFSIPPFVREGEGEAASSSAFFLYDTAGALLVKVPLAEFEIVVQEGETVVFAHREADFFERLGLASAAFEEGSALPAKGGLEVAQIDWDGQTTRVDWTTVQAVQETEGTPVLVLDDGVLRGASGGGIFWNGYHVANTWRFEEQLDTNGELIDTITVAALNTAAVVQ